MALPAIIAAVRGGWDNVQSLSIKSTKSASLPIWSCKLGTEEGARWDGLQVEDGASQDNDDSETVDVEIPYTAKPTKTTSKPSHHPRKRADGGVRPPYAD
jgi:ribosome biogenesis protein UTP30